jgi:cyclic pyranopterin phosphate synthase
MSDELTHLDDEGAARMVDVSDKSETDRRATARGYIYLAPETFERLRSGDAPKGEVLGPARLAGIMGAKKTGDLVPLCHPIPLTHVDVRFEWLESASALRIEATARCRGRTGVEMEALCAVTTAALSVYDMTKGIDRTVTMGDFHVCHKSGGRSGDWHHPSPPGPESDDSQR